MAGRGDFSALEQFEQWLNLSETEQDTVLFPIVDEEKIALSEFSNSEKCREAANPFGLVGMAVGEWCADSYRPNYNDASDNDLPVVGESPYVVRGGAAILSPWQGVGEWLTCVSAMRLWDDNSPESQGYSGRFLTRIPISLG
ncbi:MAG TPA: hypothetical protein V6C95_07655 [Coleofasciculaceae cyanobacterium]